MNQNPATKSSLPLQDQQRTLAAIVFTDVVSFSARMNADEDKTMQLLKEDTVYIQKACDETSGMVLKSTGDGFLMYFNSAVQAVKCALAIQNRQAERLKTTAADDILQHRIGIHLGDVFASDGDVMGDGVNIAARLEAEAEPGGICISQTVHDVVKNKISLKTNFLGPRDLKNIKEAVPVYQVLLDAAGPHMKQSRRRRRPGGAKGPPPWIWAMVGAAVVVVGLFIWDYTRRAPVPVEIAAAPIPPPVEPAPAVIEPVVVPPEPVAPVEVAIETSPTAEESLSSEPVVISLPDADPAFAALLAATLAGKAPEVTNPEPQEDLPEPEPEPVAIAPSPAPSVSTTTGTSEGDGEEVLQVSLIQVLGHNSSFGKGRDYQRALTKTSEMSLLGSWVKSSLVTYSERFPLRVVFFYEGQEYPVNVWGNRNSMIAVKARNELAEVQFEEIGPQNLGQLIYALMQEKIRIGVTLSKKVTVGEVEFTKAFNLPELGIQIRDLLYRSITREKRALKGTPTHQVLWHSHV